MAEREIGVGVVGYGLGGRVFHAPFVSAVPGLKLVSIMTSKADETEKAYPSVRISSSIEDLLARHPELQGIVNIPGIAEPFAIDRGAITQIANKYLSAVHQAGAIYRHVHEKRAGHVLISRCRAERVQR